MSVIRSLRIVFAKLSGYTTVLKNIGYLTILQGINLLIPLITLPYLIRVLGSEVYGQVIFAQAVASYLVIIVSFGFSVTGVQEVSIHREDRNKLSEIVSAVYIIKATLFIISILIILVLAGLASTYEENLLLIILSMWLCLYEVIFPEWYFQGIEKMKIVTFVTSIFRFIFLLLIFTLVKNEEDFLLVPIINGIGALVAGLIGMYIVFVKHRVKFSFLPFSVISYYLRESLPVFFYKSSQVYIKLNKVLIGTFVGMSAVSYYDIAEKIVTVLKMPISIVSQAVFPKNVKEKDIVFVVRSFLIILSLCIVLVALLVLTAEPLVVFLGGKELSTATPIVRLLVFTLIPVAFNSIFAAQLLFAFGYKKHYMWAIVFAGITYILCVSGMYLTASWTLLGIGCVVLISECITSLCSLIFIKKLNIFRR